MRRRGLLTTALLLALLMPTLAVSSVRAEAFADSAFEQTWARTDKPVADGSTPRTWMWGPEPFTGGMMENYTDSPGGKRKVQYFDKSRMEINNPNAPNDGLWYVTNGLLVVEMMTGQVQQGSDDFVPREAANINIAGDPAGAEGLSPTYAELGTWGLRNIPPLEAGATITWKINGEGNLSVDASLAQYGVTAAELVSVPGINHRVASVFWDFMNSSGLVYENGQLVNEKLFENAYYATGLPVTEAYWSNVMIGGTERTVLWQCFERRCLTYTPGNPQGFAVEAGNVGQHYYRWIYDNQPPVEDEYFYAEFGSMNGSGVYGDIYVTLRGLDLILDVSVYGLEPGGEHASSIYGFANGSDARCPSSGDDGNLDFRIDLNEAKQAFGQELKSLGSYDIGAGADGTIDGLQIYTLTQAQRDALGDLSDNVFVLQGMTAQTDLGEPGDYDETIPVACADIYDSGTQPQPEVWTFPMRALNGAGTSGYMELEQVNDLLRMQVGLSGLEPNEGYVLLLVGAEDGTNARCPDLSGLDVTLQDLLGITGNTIVAGGQLVTEADGTSDWYGTAFIDLEEVADLGNYVAVLFPISAENLAGVPAGCGDVDGESPQGFPVEYDITPVNASGVTGSVTLLKQDGELQVEAQLAGLVPGMHAWGLFPGPGGTVGACPTAAQDANADGVVDETEALAVLGDPLVNFIAFTADDAGNVTYSGTLGLGNPLTLANLIDSVVVIRGIQTDVVGVSATNAPAACGVGEVIVPSN